MENIDAFIEGLNGIEVLNVEPIEYRLHYDSEGNIYACSMRNHPIETEYLVVDEQQYRNYFRYKVVDGKLTLINTNPGLKNRLHGSEQSFSTVNGHRSILASEE